MFLDKTLGVLGAGNMGEALIRGVLKASLMRPSQIIASRRSADALVPLHTELRVRTTTDNRALVRSSDVVLVGVKPQALLTTLDEVADLFTPDRALISIAAGVPIRAIEARLPDRVPVVRVMPNTPSLVGEGASAYCLGTHADAAHALEAADILSAVGIALEVAEEHMDAMTALSGSGPAYIFYLLECLYRAADEMGLPHELARAMVRQMLGGAARLAGDSEAEPAELRHRVSSPGGTAEAAVRVLDDQNFGQTMVEAIRAARDRSRELGGGGGGEERGEA